MWCKVQGVQEFSLFCAGAQCLLSSVQLYGHSARAGLNRSHLDDGRPMPELCGRAVIMDSPASRGVVP